MWRQTSGWVTCAKPSRRNTDPGVPHTFSRRFLKQNYPKYISDVVSKILEEKNNYQMFYLNLWSSWNWVSCGESWKPLLPIFLLFHRTDFGGFLVCCYKAIQQLNGVEKNSVAISLMLNHNLTGLLLLLKRPETSLKALVVTKRNRSSYVQVTIITVNSQSAWDVKSHSLHVKVLDFAPFVVRWNNL